MSGQNTVNPGEEGSVNVAAEIARINAATAPKPAEQATETENTSAELETVQEGLEGQEATGQTEDQEDTLASAKAEQEEGVTEEDVLAAQAELVEEEDQTFEGYDISEFSRVLDACKDNFEFSKKLASHLQRGSTDYYDTLLGLVSAVELEFIMKQQQAGLTETNESDTLAEAASEVVAEGETPAEEAPEVVAEGETPAEAPAEVIAEGETPAEAPAEVIAEGETPAEAQTEVVAEGETPAEAQTEVVAEGETPAEAQTEVVAEGETPEEAPAEVVAEGETPAEAPAEVVAEPAALEPSVSPVVTFSTEAAVVTGAEIAVEEEKAEVEEPANDPQATEPSAPSLGM